MCRRLSAVVLSVCCLVSTAASAQSQGSGSRTQGVVLEINIIEMTGAQQTDIEKVETGKTDLSRLLSDGKARLIAGLQVRTRTGENFSARVGQRVPIQTGTLPVARPTERPQPNSRETSQPAAPVIVPQIAYENTGVIVDGVSTAGPEGLLDIRIKIELTGLDHSTGNLTPTFRQRSFSNAVRMKESETAMLLGFVQPEGRSASLEQIASGDRKAVSSGIVVLLTTKPVR